MRVDLLSTASTASVRARTRWHRSLSAFGLACALLLTSVLVLPASATAVGSTIVSLDVAPTSVTAGARVRVSGIVRSTTPGISGTGRIVSVFARTTTPGASWQHIGSARTDSRSRYNLYWTANGTSQLQVRFAGSTDLASANSVTRVLRVRAALSVPRIAGLRTAVLTGTRLTWTARTSVAAAGARVSIQVLSRGWREVAASRVGASGTISIAVIPAVGVQRYRLAVQATRSLAGVVSAATVVRTASRTTARPYTPFRADGSVKISTNTYDPAKYGRTSCRASAVSSAPGVWECTNREFFFDSCWVRVAGARQLVCFDGPTPQPASGAVLTWTGDESARVRQDRYPLQLTLTDGEICYAGDDDSYEPAPVDFSVKYYCQKGGRLLVPANRPPVDMSGPVWTAWKSVDRDTRAVPVVVATALFAGARPEIEPATSVGCPVRTQLERFLPRGQHWPSSARILCVDGGWTLVLDGAGKARQMFRPVKLGWRWFAPGGICDDPSPYPAGLWVRNCQGS